MKIRSLLKSLLGAYTVTGIFLVVLAFLLYRMDLKETAVEMGIAAAYILSCFFGGFFLGKQTKNRRYLWGLLLGFCYFALLFGVSMLSGKGTEQSVSHAVTAFAMCLLGGALGGMLA